MRQLVSRFLSGEITRRRFVQGLAALGLSAAGVESVVRASERALKGAGVAGRALTGTGGELLVEQMKEAGVRYLFTNPGSFEVGFFDAFLDQPGMQLILGLHEGLVIAMADGYHKITGRPAFVNVHVIAGTAQSAGQMYNSSRDGSALVVTAGLLDNEQGNDDILLGPRPGFNQKEVNRQFTKISWEGRNASALPMMLRRAFKVSMTEPSGPVYLAVPNYILEEKGVSGTVYSDDQFMLPAEIPPATEAVEELARGLVEARAPILFLGPEVAKYHAQAEAHELAHLLSIPVAEGRLTAFHGFPRHDPLFAGGFSSRGKDFVVNVGGPDMGGGTVPVGAAYEPGARVASIGLNTDAIGRTHPFTASIVANVKLTLRALIDAVKSQVTEERLAKIREERPLGSNRKPEIDQGRIGLQPIHPDELGWAMGTELDADAIVVSENLSGSNHFLSTGFRENEKTWISTSGAGLGWGIGAATGVKLGEPNRQVVCNIGDGSVMYSASGFWTQARYHVPVLTVVANNFNYQTVRTAYHRYGGKMKAADRYCGMFLGSPDIDFVKLAQSQGVEGVKVDRSADLRPALRRGIEATRAGEPFVVEVVIARTGGGADSTWFEAFNLAAERTRAV